jgi:hypothetical protein
MAVKYFIGSCAADSGRSTVEKIKGAAAIAGFLIHNNRE